MLSTYLLIALAIFLAAAHMVAPDHWLPLSMLSSKRKYRNSYSSSLSLLIGLSHGLFSVALSLLVAFAGLVFFGEGAVKIGSAALLVAVATYMIINAAFE
ncbi:MAG: hypothetical protein QXP70_06485, partial [Methanomassiliicoccales archaeon]